MEVNNEGLDNDPRNLKKLRNDLKRKRKAQTEPLERKILKKQIHDLKIKIDRLNSTDQESEDSSAGADQMDSSYLAVASPVKTPETADREAVRPKSTHGPRGESDPIPSQDSRASSRVVSLISSVDCSSTVPIQAAFIPRKPANQDDAGDFHAAPTSTGESSMPGPLSVVCHGRPHDAPQHAVGIRAAAPRSPTDPTHSGAAAGAADQREADDGAESVRPLPRSTERLSKVRGSASKVRGSAPVRLQSSCIHRRRISQCKECGGGGVCVHRRRKYTCKDCGGSGICIHGRQKSQCRDCGGGGICIHDRQRSKCRECGGGSVCAHGRHKSRCQECGGGSLCAHGRRKSRCKDCKGRAQAKA
jgi:hypothetical protein